MGTDWGEGGWDGGGGGGGKGAGEMIYFSDNNNNEHFYVALALAKSKAQWAVQKDTEKCIKTYNGQQILKGFRPYDHQTTRGFPWGECSKVTKTVCINKPQLLKRKDS